MIVNYHIKVFLLFLFLLGGQVFSQNISVNTTGAANSTSSMFEVLQPSVTNNTVGLFSRHSGAATNAYAIWAEATAATNKYAIVVPSGGGRVGFGLTAPLSILHLTDAAPALTFTHSGGINQDNTGIISFYEDATGGMKIRYDGFNNKLHIVGRNAGVDSDQLTVMRTGNVGIGNTSPASILDVTSTTSGFLAPRMTNAQRTAIVSPATGSLIYQTDVGATAPTGIGFYYYPSGGPWTAFGGGGGGGGWLTSGNTLTGTLPATPNEFIGTINGADFIIKTNNTEWMRIRSATGATSIGSDLTLGTNTAQSHRLYAIDGADRDMVNFVTTGNSFATKSVLNISSNTTGGTGGSSTKMINLTRTGANANASHTAYGLYSSVANTGTTNTNISGYFTSTGGSSYNVGVYGYLPSTVTSGTTYGVLGKTDAVMASGNTTGVYGDANTASTGGNVRGLYGYADGNVGSNVIGLYAEAGYNGTSTTKYAAWLENRDATPSATHYGLYSKVYGAGASTTNVAGYFYSSGATNNYAIRMGGSTSGTLDISPAATTTSYSAVMPAAIGTASQVLAINSVAGTTATLGWSTVSGVLIGVQTFTASGTYVPTAGTTKIFVEIIGGGGGGGGGTAQMFGVQGIATGGGGSGAYCAKLITNVAAGGNTIVIGAGGVTGTDDGVAATRNGVAGGTSSFLDNATATTYTASGGSGGAGYDMATAPPIIWVGGAGGTAPLLGDIKAAGSPGGPGIMLSTTAGTGVAGEGGSAHYGGGARGPVTLNATYGGYQGSNYGSGGSGSIGIGLGSGTPAGGRPSGSSGVVIVWEYK